MLHADPPQRRRTGSGINANSAPLRKFAFTVDCLPRVQYYGNRFPYTGNTGGLVLRHAMDVLKLFGGDELSSAWQRWRAGLDARQAPFRAFIRSMADAGFLERDPTSGRYSPGWRSAPLADLAERSAGTPSDCPADPAWAGRGNPGDHALRRAQRHRRGTHGRRDEPPLDPARLHPGRARRTPRHGDGQVPPGLATGERDTSAGGEKARGTH